MAQPKSYHQRWYDLALRIIQDRGRIYCIGFLVGILATRTQVDWDLKRTLDRLEDRLGN